jgi:hypothetical protein
MSFRRRIADRLGQRAGLAITGPQSYSQGSLRAVDMAWAEDFDIVDLPSGKPGRHDDHAEVEVFLPGGQDEQVQVRLALAMGWPLECDQSVLATVLSSAQGGSRSRAGFPVDLPDGDQQMTLLVSLPLFARWNEACRRAVIGEVLHRLAKSGIQHKIIQVAAGGVIYLPTTSAEG